jgi:hypothetical protein
LDDIVADLRWRAVRLLLIDVSVPAQHNLSVFESICPD